MMPTDAQNHPMEPADRNGYSMPHTRRDVLDRVREEVQEHARDRAPLDELRQSLDALATLAKEDGVPPERLIVELKQALSEVPTLRGLEPQARSDITASLVLRAIEAYYTE
jgi:hypothetical protein